MCQLTSTLFCVTGSVFLDNFCKPIPPSSIVKDVSGQQTIFEQGKQQLLMNT